MKKTVEKTIKKAIILISSAIMLVAAIFLFTFLAEYKNIEIEYVPDPLEAFYDAISSEYPLGVMEALSQFGTNTELGFRTSGSVAELAAADYLYEEMHNIGLQNVIKDRLIVDSWEFESAAAIEPGVGIFCRLQTPLLTIFTFEKMFGGLEKQYPEKSMTFCCFQNLSKNRLLNHFSHLSFACFLQLCFPFL